MARGWPHLVHVLWNGSAHVRPRLSLPPACSIATLLTPVLALRACVAWATAISELSHPVEWHFPRLVLLRAHGAAEACLGQRRTRRPQDTIPLVRGLYRADVDLHVVSTVSDALATTTKITRRRCRSDQGILVSAIHQDCPRSVGGGCRCFNENSTLDSTITSYPT
jgi:hypothetical protein